MILTYKELRRVDNKILTWRQDAQPLFSLGLLSGHSKYTALIIIIIISFTFHHSTFIRHDEMTRSLKIQGQLKKFKTELEIDLQTS